jgi:hypothetical protein
MPNTYTLLETITVGAAGASSVTFNSIPQTGYTDLVVKISARTTRANSFDILNATFNTLSTNQTARIVYGNGASAISTTDTNIWAGVTTGNTATSNTFGNSELYIPNYTSSNFKSMSIDQVNETNGTTAYAILTAGLWSATAAISSIGFASSTGSTLMQHSTFSLYGVSALGTTPTRAPKATGGDIIMTDGTYWSHTFLSSGTFTPATALSCDYLVVAGGGAGSGDNNAGSSGGGGGAGGYLTSIGGSPLSLSTTNYTVTIGAGGAGSRGTQSNGSNSVFSSITATGGGAGGIQSSINGVAGGSGGGGTASGSTSGTGGSASPSGQGNAGGNGVQASWWGTGGGGGAGSVGGNGTGGASRSNSTGGAGGTGTSNSISGSAVTYAAGGGGGGFDIGGTGGSSIGGNGASSTNGSSPRVASAGVANTGSGGGGGSDGSTSATGASGGSGVVIIRYLA